MTRIIAILVAAVVIAAGAWYFWTGQDADTVSSQDYEFSETATDFGLTEMTLGAEDAPVTLVEYASFTCPHCQRFHADVFPKLKQDYIDTGKVRFAYREVYFDRPGLWASMVARCTGEDKFFGIADLIYKGQSTWAHAGDGDPAVIIAELSKIGRLAGIDGDTLDACLKDADKAENLAKWSEQNLERDEITSTPSLVLNGKKYKNMSYDDLKDLIDAGLDN